MKTKLEDFIQQKPVIKEILEPKNKLIMVIGGPDTGKTSLVEGLADMLAKKTDVGIVDLDMGQSHIGLPTTIAWGKLHGGFKSWPAIKPENFYFTGVLTPVGSLLPTVVGAKLITDKAVLSCDKVVIDTTGLIAEPIGRVLKQFKIELLSPDILLALEYADELKPLLESFKMQKQPNIWRFPVPDQICAKSLAKRTQFRNEKLRAYFTGARTFTVQVSETSIRFTKGPPKFSATALQNKLVSLRDGKNRDIALGFIKTVQVRDKAFSLCSPIEKKKKFSTILIGEATISL